MGMTITLKNIPEEVYERLKLSAGENRRSLNREAIVCLERALLAGAASPAQRLARARGLREGLEGRFAAGEIDRLKRKGRA
jgi:plasmid stability protein